jgi:hypothetical protein
VYKKLIKKLIGNRERYSSAGFLESSSIELLNACNENSLDKVKMLKNYVNFDVCDNKGYSPLIIAVVSVQVFFLFVFTLV